MCQQRIHYHSESRGIPDWIVSLVQAHIRPIVRGKSRCNFELGDKISISATGDGSTFLDGLSFDPYNEGEDLKAQMFAYRRRHGHCPAVVCADKSYRTRSNRAICAHHKIRLSDPRLGTPKSNPDLVAQEKRLFINDQRRRNAVAGKTCPRQTPHWIGPYPREACAHSGFNHYDGHFGDEPTEAAGASFCAFHMLASSSLGQRIG